MFKKSAIGDAKCWCPDCGKAEVVHAAERCQKCFQAWYVRVSFANRALDQLKR